MSELILFGEPMVMFVADTAGDLAEVDHFTKMLAGAEVNVAIGMRRLGHSVTYVTKLGCDPLGEYISRRLETEGLNPQVIFDETHWTGFQMKDKVTEGDPLVFYFRRNSAASSITPQEIEQIDFTGAKLLHITGIPPAISLSCRDATYRIMELARENGLYISFDPNLRPGLWEDETTMVRVINDLAVKADLVLPGTGEGKILMGSEKPEDIADFYLSQGVSSVIVKAGARGAYAADKDGGRYCPGFRVEKVVDTVGAGDGFAVGALSGLLEGLPLEKMCERGNAIGAMQVSVRGDNEGLPTPEILAEFLEERA